MLIILSIPKMRMSSTLQRIASKLLGTQRGCFWDNSDDTEIRKDRSLEWRGLIRLTCLYVNTVPVTRLEGGNGEYSDLKEL